MAPPSPLTLAVGAEVRARKAAGETYVAIAADLTTRLGTAFAPQNLINYLHYHGADLDKLEAARKAPLPLAERRAWDRPLRLAGSFLVLSDVHIPCHSRPFLDACLTLADAWGVESVLLNGDTVDMAGASVKFPPAPEDASIESEWQTSKDFTGCLEDRFGGCRVFLPGNHEDRLPSILQQRITIETVATLLLRDPARWLVTPYAYVHVGDWCIAHPGGSSVIPGRYAQRMALVERTHVIAAHGHVAGQSRAENGCWAIDSGGCFDPVRMGYAVRIKKARAKMAQGAVLLTCRQGVYRPVWLHPELDFAAYRRLYRPGELDPGAALEQQPAA